MKSKKLLLIVFIFLLNFIFITKVKADSWLDEGNYSIQTRSKE